MSSLHLLPASRRAKGSRLPFPRRVGPFTPWLLGLLLLVALGGCTSDAPALRCGEGTRLVGDTCVPETDDGGPSRDAGPADASPDVDGVVPDASVDAASPTKSPKRGIAYNMVNAEDFGAISSSVSWWYNWYFGTEAPTDVESAHDMQFIPMLWGHNAEADYAALERWFLDHPGTNDLLVMNEPNLVDQANLSPSAAVGHWLRYEEFQTRMRTEHSRTIRLIGPAITWGTMPGFADPVVWLDAFYAAFNAAEGRDPVIDALAFHWYDYGLEEQLTRLERYGKPFWVTEMANWHTAADWTIDTPEKQIQTMMDMVRICEARADVERYAWFMGRWDPDPHYTSIFEDAPGALSALGEAYLSQPW